MTEPNIDEARVLAALRRSNAEVVRLRSLVERHESDRADRDRLAAALERIGRGLEARGPAPAEPEPDPGLDRALDALEAVLRRLEGEADGCGGDACGDGPVVAMRRLPGKGGVGGKGGKAPAHAAAGHESTPKHVAAARQRIEQAHREQQARNRAEAARKPVHELPKPEHWKLKYYRDQAKEIDTEEAESKKFVAENRKKYEDIEKKLKAYRAKAFDWGNTARTRKLNATLAEKLRAEHKDLMEQFERHRYLTTEQEHITHTPDGETHRVRERPYDRRRRENQEHLAKAQAAHDAKEAPKYDYAKAHADHPDLIAPGPIAERMKQYTAGDVKVRELANLEAPIERLRAKQEEHHERIRDLLGRQAKEADKIWDYREGDPEHEGNVAKVNAAVDRLQARIDRHVEHVKELKDQEAAEAAKIRDHVRSLIAVKEGHAFKATDVPPGFEGALEFKGPNAGRKLVMNPPTGDTRKAIDEAQDWLHAVTARSDTPAIERMYGESPGARAYHSGSGDHISLSVGEDARTVVHELGHALDESIVTNGKKLVESSLAFKDHRLKGEQPEKFVEKFPDSGYEAHEAGAKDEFDKAFPERSAYYVGKDYGRHATEIVSMGIEKLYHDPVNFAKKDPEYAKFILGVLDGSLR